MKVEPTFLEKRIIHIKKRFMKIPIMKQRINIFS